MHGRDGIEMKAVIMAAGKGVRMLPLTKEIPKVLVKVDGKPFLLYVIENLTEAGFDEIGIVAGYKKEKIKDFILENGINAEIIEQEEQLGTGDAIRCAEEFVDRENFVAVGGDNLWSSEDIRAAAKDDDVNYIGAIEAENPEKYGVLVVEGELLIEIKEKPKEFVGNLINTGLYKFTPEIFEALKWVKKSERGEYELTDAVSLLAKKGKVKVVKVRDYWLDLGCIQDIERIEDFLRNINADE